MANKKQKKPIEITLLDNRRYTVVEKTKIVAQIEQGILSFNEALQRYKISSRKTLYSWVTTYAKEPAVVQKGKKYSYAHRRQVALNIQAGLLCAEEAARQNSVSSETIADWLTLLQQVNLEEKPTVMSKDNQDKPMQAAVEALQLKIAALETMIDLAEEKWKIDIRKKCGTKQQ
jgi:transposase-like protein